MKSKHGPLPNNVRFFPKEEEPEDYVMSRALLKAPAWYQAVRRIYQSGF
jgi:hypothetical protein